MAEMTQHEHLADVKYARSLDCTQGATVHPASARSSHNRCWSGPGAISTVAIPVLDGPRGRTRRGDRSGPIDRLPGLSDGIPEQRGTAARQPHRSVHTAARGTASPCEHKAMKAQCKPNANAVK